MIYILETLLQAVSWLSFCRILTDVCHCNVASHFSCEVQFPDLGLWMIAETQPCVIKYVLNKYCTACNSLTFEIPT